MERLRLKVRDKLRGRSHSREDRDRSEVPSRPEQGTVATEIPNVVAKVDSEDLQQRFGLFEFTKESESKDCTVDIIAVHGLRGHFESTWTWTDKTTDTKTLWLRDFLPNQLRDSNICPRVFSYGYDSASVFSRSNTDIEREAYALLSRLDDHRESPEEAQRPIIFVAHSLGGLLVKQAMISANTRSNLYGHILKAIRGIVFLGVPHRGADLAYWDNLATNVINCVSFGSYGNNAFVEALKRDSKSWGRISRDFVERADRPLQIRSFFETDKIANVLIVDEDSATLNLPNEKVSSIPGSNHKTICRFNHQKCQRYDPVWKAIRKMVPSDSPTYKFSKEEEECVQTIYRSNYEEHQMRNPEPTPGTCQWVLEHADYLRWRDPTSSNAPLDEHKTSNLLWISADPGSGKSVLARFLIDKFSTIDREEITNVCYFFFKDDSDLQNNAVLALRAILHQLFGAQRELVKYASSEYKSKGLQFVKEINTLWNILLLATADEKANPTICVIDGLDECEESTQIPFIDLMARHFKNDASRQQLKFLVLSRPYHAIEQKIKQALTIRLKVEDESDLTAKDVELMIRGRIQDFSDKRETSEDLKGELTEKILNASDRTFLWASLVLNDLESSLRISDKSLSRLINQIPTSLDAMYEKILNRTKDQENTRKILHIIVGASRPLSLAEMNIAFSIDSEDHNHDDIDLEPIENVGNLVRNLCGLFVKVKDSKLYLIHQTAKEFLVATGDRSMTILSSWKHSLHPIDSNIVILEICVMYLLLNDFEDEKISDDLRFRYRRGPLVNKSREQRCENYKFLDYAATYWPSHFQIAQNQSGKQLMESIGYLYDSQCHRFKLWLAYSSVGFKSFKGVTGLMAASCFGHDRIAKSLIEKGEDFELEDDDGMTALHHAARWGQDEIVKLLIESGANTCVVDKRNKAALTYAAEKCDVSTLKLLLKKGFGALAKTQELNCALSAAIGSENEAAVRLLLKEGADVNQPSQLDYSWPRSTATPLCQAIAGGHESIFKLLIEKGADVQATTSTGSPPLHYAARRRNTSTATILMQKGANIHATDSHGHTALHEAARSGDLAMVELFISKGMDIMAKDNDGETILHCACQSDDDARVAIVKLFVGKGVDVQGKDNTGKTPLHYAAECDDDTVVKLLVDFGANILERDKYEKTTLHYAAATRDYKEARQYYTPFPQYSIAAKPGRGVTVKFLIEKDVNIHAKDKTGKTALHYAAEHGDDKIIELLIDLGADVLERDNASKTPLHHAAERGLDAAFKLLVEKGADIEGTDNTGKTSLHYAAKCGRVEAIKLLIEKGVDIQREDNARKTSLYYAAKGYNDAVVKLLVNSIIVQEKDITDNKMAFYAVNCGEDALVKLLLDNGVDLRARDNDGKTTLQYAAAKGGNDAVVKLLIDRGFDIQERDDKGKTALHYAVAEDGSDATIKLLLQNGVDMQSKDHRGMTALHYAAELGRCSATRMLIREGANVNSRDNRGCTTIHLATHSRSKETVELLIESGADTSLKDNDRMSVLHHAARSCCDEEIVKLLIKGKVDINSKDKKGTAPLHYAAIHGRHGREIFKLLIKKGVDISSKDNNGMTVLHYAARWNDNKAIVGFLIKEGIHIGSKDNNGMTVLHHAAQNVEANIFEFLVKKGADISSKDNNGMTVLHHAARWNLNKGIVEFLIKEGIDIGSKDNNGMTVLHHAAWNGRKKIFEFLVKEGADISLKDNDGMTILHHAALGGNEKLVRLFIKGEYDIGSRDYLGRTALRQALRHDSHLPRNREEVANLLINEGSDMQVRNCWGYTALHYAAERGHDSVARILLENGADIQTEDNCGYTALHHAEWAGKKNLITLLSSFQNKNRPVDSKQFNDSGGNEGPVRDSEYWPHGL